MRTHVAALVLTALTASLTGCGDDDPSAAPPPAGAAPSASATSAEGTEEVVNPCAPDADPAEIALEGPKPAPGAPIIDVGTKGYAFTGVPAQLPPGPRGFRLVNTGTELHELALVRFLDEDARTLPQVMDLPDHGVGTVVSYVGGAAACPGGTTEALGVDLQPGRYGLVSFVSVGTTPDLRGSALLAAYENPPQYSKGMYVDFTVTHG